MSKNAKNQLFELLKALGCRDECATFDRRPVSSGVYCSTVVIRFPDGHMVQGEGTGQGISEADIAAAQDALEQWHQNYPDLVTNWDELQV